MEPANLTPFDSTGSEDARLESWLRSAPPALPDNGFSARVLAALPPPRRDWSWLRPFTCAIGLFVGVAFAWEKIDRAAVFAVSRTYWQDSLAALSRGLETSAWTTMPAALALALVVAAASMIYAFHSDRRSTLR